MIGLPDRRTASFTVDRGYAWRCGWATTLVVWLRRKAITTALILVMGAAVILAGVFAGSLAVALLGGALIAVRALSVIAIAASVAAASRTTSPPGSVLRLRIDERTVELASSTTTIRVERSEIDRVIRRLGFVWLRRGRPGAWLGIPVALLEGPADPSVDVPAAPLAARAPAAPPATPEAPAASAPLAPEQTLLETALVVDADWIRDTSRSLLLVVLPWSIGSIVLGIALAAGILAATGMLDPASAGILVAVLVPVVALAMVAIAVRLRRSVARLYPPGAEIRLRIGERTLRLETPRGSVERTLASIVRMRRRGSIVSVRMRGALWNWMPGGLLDDRGLALVRSRLGARR